MTKKWKLYLFCLFLFFLIFSFIYPPFNSDSVRYSAPGNPFYLQYLDYMGIYNAQGGGGLFSNGRYFVHIILRTILQMQEPLLSIIYSLLLTAITFIFIYSVKPSFYKENNKNFSYTFLLLILLLLLNPDKDYVDIRRWFIHAHAISNFLSMAMILWFLIPYRKLLTEKNQTFNLFTFILLGIIAGLCHEQGVAVPIFLICYYFYLLLYKKIKIPRWYWLGIISFSIGLTIVLIPATNEGRLLEYGGVNSWEFLGKTYNWLELGIEKYFYAFVKHFILGKYTLQVLPICLIIFYLWYKIFKKNTKDNVLEVSLFYFILSWMIVGVMSASPVFGIGTRDNGTMILYVSVMGLYYQSLEYNIISQKFAKIVNYICCAILLLTISIQMIVLIPRSIEYRKTRAYIEAEYKKGEKNIVVPEMRISELDTPLGKMDFQTFEITRFLLERYQLESITVTNDKNESYIIKK